MRYTVRDAATYLGISESAVRNRLSRGTLVSERADGVTYVVLDDISPGHEPTDETTQNFGEFSDPRDELIRTLQDALAAEREANRENRRLLAAALQMHSIEDRRGSGGHEEEPAPPRAGSGSATSTRSWWRRLFGG